MDSYVLQDVESTPPLRREKDAPHLFHLKVPEDWNGEVHATYSLLKSRVNSRAQDNKGLLPWRAEN
ncbi:MAG: hypothetical protein ACI8PQ_000709 [Planctomycetota bacterium]